MVQINKEKESAGIVGRERAPEEFPTVESPRKKDETPLEVDSWITKIEKRLGRIPQGQPGPQDDQVVVQQPQSHQPPVKLPVTQQQLITGKKVKTDYSIAWLVAWAIRQIKIMTKLGRKIELSEIPEVPPEVTKEKS